jgi:hypothetical protein
MTEEHAQAPTPIMGDEEAPQQDIKDIKMTPPPAEEEPENCLFTIVCCPCRLLGCIVGCCGQVIVMTVVIGIIIIIGIVLILRFLVYGK